MKHHLLAFLSIVAILTSASALADIPAGSAYLDGGSSKVALILAHGRGQHPTWKVVDPLRKGVNDDLGYHTLSLQMPNEDKEWKEYADDFPQAYAMIKDGIRYLKEEKGVIKIFLMGHSMGSRMTSAFVSENHDQAVTGLVVAGCRNNGGPLLSCEENLHDVKIPILDIWGADNGKDSDAASDREALASDTYQQVEVPGANHKFEGYEDEFVTLVVAWLKSQH
jgi:pimeloyl-ACP methyl ester carboxylesterase